MIEFRINLPRFRRSASQISYNVSFSISVALLRFRIYLPEFRIYKIRVAILLEFQKMTEKSQSLIQ